MNANLNTQKKTIIAKKNPMAKVYLNAGGGSLYC